LQWQKRLAANSLRRARIVDEALARTLAGALASKAAKVAI
jgi:hypothetical protein